MRMATERFTARAPAKLWNAIRQRLFSRRGRKAATFYGFISPWLLGFLFLTVIPLIGGLVLSFTNYDGLNWGTWKWKGIDNFTRVFSDKEVMRSLRQIAIWTLLNTPVWLVLSFILAYILNHALKARGLFRTLFYLPSVIPMVAVAWVGNLMLHSSWGLVNKIVNIFAPGTAIYWLSDRAMVSLTTLAVWTGLGSGTVIFLAALQDIPPELEEAALVDGANKWQVFRRVTIPLMTPVIFYQLVLSIVTAMQYFSLPMLLAPNNQSNKGALTTPPARQVRLTMIQVFKQAFGRSRYGYAIAISWVLVLFMGLVTALVFWSRRWWVYDARD
jgi:multiple sugar transport system permease protein